MTSSEGSQSPDTAPERNEASDSSPLIEAIKESISLLYRSAFELDRWNPHVDWASRLRAEGYLSSANLVEAFTRVKRWDFIPPEAQAWHAFDRPLPIGYDQTISQPSLVARMFEWLQPKPGDKVLDIGSGSGWSTTLLASAVGSESRVVGLEIKPDLVEIGRANLAKYDFPWAEIQPAGQELGMPAEAPFKRILVSAKVKEAWIEPLVEQLSKDEGVLVVPLTADEDYDRQESFRDSIIRVTKNGEGYNSEKLEAGVGFVPLVNNWEEPATGPSPETERTQNK